MSIVWAIHCNFFDLWNFLDVPIFSAGEIFKLAGVWISLPIRATHLQCVRHVFQNLITCFEMKLFSTVFAWWSLADLLHRLSLTALPTTVSPVWKTRLCAASSSSLVRGSPWFVSCLVSKTNLETEIQLHLDDTVLRMASDCCQPHCLALHTDRQQDLREPRTTGWQHLPASLPSSLSLCQPSYSFPDLVFSSWHQAAPSSSPSVCQPLTRRAASSCLKFSISGTLETQSPVTR